MEVIRVLLVDDQVLFVESLRKVLETDAEDIEVVGIAHHGLEAIEFVEKHLPHVILMDVRMPHLDGVEATRIIHQRLPETKIIMLTTFDDDEYVKEALRYGAAGYLLKDIPPQELIVALRAIKGGGVLISPAVAARLVEKAYSPEQAPPEPTWLHRLSKREKDVLGLLAQGHDNAKIAERLFLGEQTVKNYVSIIYSKLGVHDRVQAMKMALEAGIDSPPGS